MTLAEELAMKYVKQFVDEDDTLLSDMVASAINEALERTAQECEAIVDLCTKQGRSESGAMFCADRIRALKAAQPLPYFR
jgi:DNA-binding protein YbaB